MKKRDNPNWGKPKVNAVPYTGTSSFEEIVKKLRLSQTEYEGSIQLQEWARKNKDQKYVPSNLLQAWGLDVKRTRECKGLASGIDISDCLPSV
jgi:hypothetical protein